MTRRAWQRAVLAGALTTTAFLLWRWFFSPVIGAGTFFPWTVLGIVLAAATVLTDRFTRPFTGVATTAVGASVAYGLSGGRPGRFEDLAGDLVYNSLAAGVLAVAVSGLHLAFVKLPRARQFWAEVVVLLGALVWVAWMGWWALDGSSPSHPNLLMIGAACTLLSAAVLGELTVAPWFGALFAVSPVVLLSAAPLSTTDALWIIAWVMLIMCAGAGYLVAVGGVALIRGTHRRSFPARR